MSVVILLFLNFLSISGASSGFSTELIYLSIRFNLFWFSVNNSVLHNFIINVFSSYKNMLPGLISSYMNPPSLKSNKPFAI